MRTPQRRLNYTSSKLNTVSRSKLPLTLQVSSDHDDHLMSLGCEYKHALHDGQVLLVDTKYPRS